MSYIEDPFILKAIALLDDFDKRLDDCVHTHCEYVRAHQKTDEMKSRLLQERKINGELRGRRAALLGQDSHLNELCSRLADTLTIAPNDKRKLDSARLQLQVLKEVTGIRWDYSVPHSAATVRGYFRDEVRRSLVPFSAEVDRRHRLWDLLLRGTDENTPHN